MNGPASRTGYRAQREWVHRFIPPIRERLEAEMPGARLSTLDVRTLMDLCPFDTVASPIGKISPFCGLFTEEEWKGFDYA